MTWPLFPIYLMRHGQTEWNASRRIQGALDSPLTALGVRQARNMGDKLASILDKESAWDLVASPIGRAACTAGIVAGITGLNLRFDDRLREISLGDWDGRMVDEVKASYPELTSLPGWNFFSPNGETYEDVALRAGDWLRSVSGPIIAVAHGVLSYVVRGLYLGEPHVPNQATHTSQDGIYLLNNGTIEFIECTP